jgi:hypothetical protein
MISRCFVVYRAYCLIDYLSTCLEIELCSEGEEMPDTSKSDKQPKVAGVKYEYLAPTEVIGESEKDDNSSSTDLKGVQLDDLMSKLKHL